MRKQLIGEAPNTKIIASDMFDTAWMQQLSQNHLPTLLLVEGVFMYSTKEKIRQFLQDVATIVGPCRLIFDSVPPMLINNAKYHDALQKKNTALQYTWGVANQAELEAMSEHWRVREWTYMSDLPQADRFALKYRVLYLIAYFYRRANQLLIAVDIV